MPTRYARILASFEALHHWPDAPEEVEFLRVLHRHMFNVEVELQVFHDDRELEYYMVKRELSDYIAVSMPRLETTSCEQYADLIASFLSRQYGERKMKITILEDGMEGAVCHYDG